MKLQDYVEMKKQELLASGMRSAEFRSATKCEIGRHCVSFMLFTAETAPMDANVEEVTKEYRDTLTDRSDGMIDAYDVTFDVIKPRCRKTTMKSFYVYEV